MVTAANTSETRRREQLRELALEADAGPEILVMCALQTNNPRRAERIERRYAQLGL